MVEILNRNGHVLLEAHNLIQSIAYSSSSDSSNNFRRWLDMNVFGYAIHGYDYFTLSGDPIDYVPEKRVGRKRNNYVYFSLDFAISVCLMEKTPKSKLVRNFLIGKKESMKAAV